MNENLTDVNITKEELDRLRETLIKVESSLWELFKIYEITNSERVESLYREYQEVRMLQKSLQETFKNKAKSLIKEESK